MENNDLWTRISNALFRKADVPPSEIFVSRVMARIEEFDREQALENNWLRWLVPSFGFGFAALLFAVTFAGTRTELSAETLLLADKGAEAQWIFAENAQNDEVLGFTAEELQ